MKLARIADRVARDVYTRPIDPEARTADVVRDACDTATGSDLSCGELDRLCDMVFRRFNSPRFSRWRVDVTWDYEIARMRERERA